MGGVRERDRYIYVHPTPTPLPTLSRHFSRYISRYIPLRCTATQAPPAQAEDRISPRRTARARRRTAGGCPGPAARTRPTRNVT